MFALNEKKSDVTSSRGPKGIDGVWGWVGDRSDFDFFLHFSRKFLLSKLNSPRWDATFCGITCGAMLLPMCHKKDATQAYMSQEIDKTSSKRTKWIW